MGRGSSGGRQSGGRAWQSCSGVLGCHLGAGSIELPPLIIKDGGLALPLSPSPRHWLQSVDILPQAGVECLFKMVDESDIP